MKDRRAALRDMTALKIVAAIMQDMLGRKRKGLLTLTNAEEKAGALSKVVGPMLSKPQMKGSKLCIKSS